MNANLAVIADNLDYLLWGRLAEGQPGGVALTLLMAIGATALALPGGILLACAAWRYGGAVRRLLFLWAEIIRGIPLIFVIFWLWYLLPMLTGGDLPGAVTVTLALAWFTAASVMHSVLAGLRALPGDGSEFRHVDDKRQRGVLQQADKNADQRRLDVAQRLRQHD